MAEVVANGVRFHVQQLVPPLDAAEAVRGGTRPTVVFVHGLVMDNLSSFYLTLANPCAEAGADVMLYDLRGHGLSERPPLGYALEDSVDDLACLLFELGIDGRVHIVGNSHGGAVGLAFALSYPDRVASLVMIEGHFAIEGWGEEMAQTMWMFAFGLELDEAREWLASEGRKTHRMAAKADALIKNTSLVEDLLAGIPLPRAPLAALACPVLAIYGDESALINQARDLETLIPDFTLLAVSQRGHSILMEVPDYLQAALAWWLQGRQGPPPRFWCGAVDHREVQRRQPLAFLTRWRNNDGKTPVSDAVAGGSSAPQPM